MQWRKQPVRRWTPRHRRNWSSAGWPAVSGRRSAASTCAPICPIPSWRRSDTRYGKNFEEHYRRKWHSPLAGWHSDLTQAVNPPAISILRAETTPEFGGDTQWTNMVAAYEGLAAPLGAMVDGLRAEHAFFAAVPLLHTDERDREILKIYCEDPQVAVHPVVRVHPETGEKALFVRPGSTTRIVGFSQVESHRILDLLFEHMTRAEYTARFRWTPGSISGCQGLLRVDPDVLGV
ncbi:MAG: TauD/TfdA family dioxygenase [Actinophytocola sp.]|uniref:TauD/TfdA dioxygenase family protein n=1 Tax=Actinophytocola sp. TaxID=1872138 RepID=UPI003C745EB8